MRKKILNSQLFSRLVTGVAIMSMLLSTTLTTAQAGITVNINDNGYDSGNGVDVDVTSATSINQNNDTAINNDVDMNANTGDNNISENTGTGIDVETGDITTESTMTNVSGSNIATTEGCTSNCGEEVGITVSGNGAQSTTNVDGSFTNTADVNQQNNGSITNTTDIDANTGDNSAEKNTGGDVSIHTGSITGAVNYDNTYGSNQANVGNGGWDVELDISGNGSHADVNVDLNLENHNSVNQQNDYDIENKTGIDANTGGNDCSQTTAGGCDITTGDISFGTDITNDGGSNDTNIGGIGDTDDPNDDTDDDHDDEDPNGAGDIDDESDNDDTDNDDDKSIIDEIIDKLVPDVQAETDDGTVLGAMELPETGIGTPMAVSWIEVIVAMYLVAAGAYIRHLAQRAQSWAQNRANS